MLRARDAARPVLAGNQPALSIPGVSVGVVGRLPVDRGLAGRRMPAHDAVVGNVAEQQAVPVAETKLALGPPGTGPDALQGGVGVDVVPEAVVHNLHRGVRVAGHPVDPVALCHRFPELPLFVVHAAQSFALPALAAPPGTAHLSILGQAVSDTQPVCSHERRTHGF